MNYGETIREIRLSKALTQKEVTDNIVSLSFYAKVEKGENNLSADKFFKLLNRLNIEIDEFLFIHNDFQENPKKEIQKRIHQFPHNRDLEELLQLKEETAHLYERTCDMFYLLVSIELSCIIQKMKGDAISTDLVKPLKDFLAKTSTWGHFETKVFTDNMGFLDIDTTLLFADSLLKNFRQYSNYGIYEQDILLALINLTIRCFDEDYLEEAEYYLTLINRKQKNPKLFYERNMYLFLTGINTIKNNDISEGTEVALCAIQIFEDLDMKKSANKYQKYLDQHLELSKKQAL